MKYSQIIRATPALESIRKLRVPYAKAREIHRTYKTLEKEFVFFAEEENKLVKKYAIKDEKNEPIITGNGVISFSDVKTKEEYTAEIVKLNQFDVDVKITPISLTADEIGDQLISPETIDKLEGIIKFE